MLWTIAVILLVLWALGLVSSYTMGGFIHVLLVDLPPQTSPRCVNAFQGTARTANLVQTKASHEKSFDKVESAIA